MAAHALSDAKAEGRGPRSEGRRTEGMPRAEIRRPETCAQLERETQSVVDKCGLAGFVIYVHEEVLVQ